MGTIKFTLSRSRKMTAYEVIIDKTNINHTNERLVAESHQPFSLSILSKSENKSTFFGRFDLNFFFLQKCPTINRNCFWRIFYYKLKIESTSDRQDGYGSTQSEKPEDFFRIVVERVVVHKFISLLKK